MDQLPRRFGRYDVSILHDGFFEAPSDVLTHTAGEAARQRALEQWGRPKIRIVVNCFLLRAPDGITLVDAGTGTSWGKAFGHARTALRAMSVEPDQVGRVLITHLHGDHALGLVDGELPYFPKAEISVPGTDLAHFGDEAKRAATPKGSSRRLRHRGGTAATLCRAHTHRRTGRRSAGHRTASRCPGTPTAIAAI